MWPQIICRQRSHTQFKKESFTEKRHLHLSDITRASKMKPGRSLTLAVLLCSLVPLSNAACYGKPPMKKGATHCQDDADGTWHAVGSEWRNSRCMDCTCGSCCHAYGRPVRYPDDCVSVFDPIACQYTVHKKDNPDELCPFASVGK